MAYAIADIEDALIGALSALRLTHGAREVKTWSDAVDPGNISVALRQYPGIVVAYVGSQYAEHGARKIQHLSYAIVAADKSLRSESEARRGGARGGGAYALLDGVRDLLTGQQLGLEIYPLTIVREELLSVKDGVVAYVQEWRTSQALIYPGGI